MSLAALCRTIVKQLEIAVSDDVGKALRAAPARIRFDEKFIRRVMKLLPKALEEGLLLG